MHIASFVGFNVKKLEKVIQYQLGEANKKKEKSDLKKKEEKPYLGWDLLRKKQTSDILDSYLEA